MLLAYVVWVVKLILHANDIFILYKILFQIKLPSMRENVGKCVYSENLKINTNVGNKCEYQHRKL